MTKPKAYDPQEGYRYQILCRNPQYSREWEHCDYAKDRAEKDFLIGEYKLSYGPGWEFKHEFLPMKFWPKRISALGTVLLICCCLCFAQADPAQARISCVTKLTGQSVCTDTDTGQTYERVDKLTGDSEWVTTWPGRDRDRGHHRGRDREDRHREREGR